MPKGRGRKDSDSDAGTEEQTTVGTFETLRDEGEHFVHVKQYQKAIESFTKALEMKPGDKTCLVTRSKCYLMLGNSESALTDSEAALDQDEDGKKDIRALCMKAEALYQKGDFETALVYYHRGNKLRPELQEFRLGIQKSQEAINNSIGTPDAVKLEASGDLAFFYKADDVYNPYKVFCETMMRQNRKRYIFLNAKKEEEEDMPRSASSMSVLQKTKSSEHASVLGCLMSARHKTLPLDHPLNLSSSYRAKVLQKQKQQTKGYSKPAQQKREEKKERTKPQESGSSKTTKQLLGELFNDKAFLEKLYDSMTTNSTDTDKYIKDRSVDGLEYLNMRADFWRQQKPMYARERDRRRQQQQRSGSGRSRTGEQDPMQYILQRLEEIDEAQANGKYEQSLQKSQKTLKKVDLWGADQVKNKPAVVANLYSCMGNAYLEMGKFKEALECHNKDLALGQAHNIDEAESRALDNLGRTKARMGKYDDAIELWEKKLPKSKSALESTWLYHEIGRCHLELGHYRDAKDFGEKSYAAAQEADDRGWQLHSTVLIAQAEVKCDDLQSAVDSFERGLEIAEELKDKSAQAAIKRALEEVNARIVQGEKADGEDGVDDGRRSAKSDREDDKKDKGTKDKANADEKEKDTQKDEPSPSNAADTKEPAETEEKQPETAEQAESKAKRRQSGWKPKARFAESPFHRGDDHADEERRAATRNRRKTPRPQTASARQRIVDHLNRDEAAEKFFSGPQTGSAADVVYHPFSSNESEKFRQLFGASPSSSPTSQTSSDARIAAFVRSQTTSSDHAGDLGCRPSSAVIRIESEPITETLTGVKDGSDYDLPRARSDTSFILDARARLNRKSSSLVNSDSLIARHRIRFGTLRRPSSSSGSFMWHVSSAEIDGALPSDTVEDLADTDTTNIQDDTDTTNLPADSETTTTDHPTSSPLVSSDASQKDKTNNFPFPKNSASGNRANSSTGPGERSEELPREPSLHPPVPHKQTPVPSQRSANASNNYRTSGWTLLSDASPKKRDSPGEKPPRKPTAKQPSQGNQPKATCQSKRAASAPQSSKRTRDLLSPHDSPGLSDVVSNDSVIDEILREDDRPRYRRNCSAVDGSLSSVPRFRSSGWTSKLSLDQCATVYDPQGLVRKPRRRTGGHRSRASTSVNTCTLGTLLWVRDTLRRLAAQRARSGSSSSKSARRRRHSFSYASTSKTNRLQPEATRRGRSGKKKSSVNRQNFISLGGEQSGSEKTQTKRAESQAGLSTDWTTGDEPTVLMGNTDKFSPQRSRQSQMERTPKSPKHSKPNSDYKQSHHGAPAKNTVRLRSESSSSWDEPYDRSSSEHRSDNAGRYFGHDQSEKDTSSSQKSSDKHHMSDADPRNGCKIAPKPAARNGLGKRGSQKHKHISRLGDNLDTKHRRRLDGDDAGTKCGETSPERYKSHRRQSHSSSKDRQGLKSDGRDKLPTHTKGIHEMIETGETFITQPPETEKCDCGNCSRYCESCVLGVLLRDREILELQARKRKKSAVRYESAFHRDCSRKCSVPSGKDVRHTTVRRKRSAARSHSTKHGISHRSEERERSNSGRSSATRKDCQRGLSVASGESGRHRSSRDSFVTRSEDNVCWASGRGGGREGAGPESEMSSQGRNRSAHSSKSLDSGHSLGLGSSPSTKPRRRSSHKSLSKDRQVTYSCSVAAYRFLCRHSSLPIGTLGIVERSPSPEWGDSSGGEKVAVEKLVPRQSSATKVQRSSSSKPSSSWSAPSAAVDSPSSQPSASTSTSRKSASTSFLHSKIPSTSTTSRTRSKSRKSASVTLCTSSNTSSSPPYQPSVSSGYPSKSVSTCKRGASQSSPATAVTSFTGTTATGPRSTPSPAKSDTRNARRSPSCQSASVTTVSPPSSDCARALGTSASRRSPYSSSVSNAPTSRERSPSSRPPLPPDAGRREKKTLTPTMSTDKARRSLSQSPPLS